MIKYTKQCKKKNQSGTKVRIQPHVVIFQLLNYLLRGGLLTSLCIAVVCPEQISTTGEGYIQACDPF